MPIVSFFIAIQFLIVGASLMSITWGLAMLFNRDNDGRPTLDIIATTGGLAGFICGYPFGLICCIHIVFGFLGAYFAAANVARALSGFDSELAPRDSAQGAPIRLSLTELFLRMTLVCVFLVLAKAHIGLFGPS